MAMSARLTGGLPVGSLRQSNEGSQEGAQNESGGLPPELAFPELETFKNEDMERTSGFGFAAPCVDCSKSTAPCCGRL